MCEYLTANCLIIGSKLAKEAFAGKATEKKPAKKSSTPLGEEDTTSGEEEENKEEEGVEEAEDEDSVEDEDEEEMSSRKTKSMTPPRPKKPTKEKSSLSPDGVEKLVRGVNKLLVASSYSLDASFPHIMYSYQRDGIDYTTMDMFVPPLPMSSFEPFVDNDMVTVGVRMIVPAIFAQKQRLLLAARIDANSTKAAAFEKECQKIDEDFDFTTTGFKSKTAHTVKCPYKVESIIVIWEVLYYPNGDEELMELLGIQQFYMVFLLWNFDALINPNRGLQGVVVSLVVELVVELVVMVVIRCRMILTFRFRSWLTMEATSFVCLRSYINVSCYKELH